MSPVVLDFDASVGALPGALVLPLADWQERIRFGCRRGTLTALARHLDARLPARHGTVFLGSGDYHHVSWPLIARQAGRCDVVVFDNHPDNMRYLFGVHCGSWVRRVAALPNVACVHVVGITSSDVALAHAWENHLLPLARGKLRYWCLGVDTRWARRLRLPVLGFDSSAQLLDRYADEVARRASAVYLSIDKDVLHPDAARTNWDQGQLSADELLAAVALLRGKLVGSDVTGEVSTYRYRSPLKRWLSALDDQPQIAPAELAAWQAQQRALNLRLLEAIG